VSDPCAISLRKKREYVGQVQRIVTRVNVCANIFLLFSFVYSGAVARVNAHKAKRFSNTSVFTMPLRRSPPSKLSVHRREYTLSTHKYTTEYTHIQRRVQMRMYICGHACICACRTRSPVCMLRMYICVCVICSTMCVSSRTEY